MRARRVHETCVIPMLLLVAGNGVAEQPHEAPTCDEWVRMPSAYGGGVPHCGPWVRDGYVSVQVNVDKHGCNIVGDAANEPSIAVDPNDPRRLAIGWRQFDSVESSFRQAGFGYSGDAGRSWAFPGVLDPGVFGSDPVLAVGAESEFYYSTINYDETRLFRSQDRGVTWPSNSVISEGLIDKPWFAVDTTGGEGRGNIYLSGSRRFFRSTDSGRTFVNEARVGIFPTLAVGSDGALYLVEFEGFAVLWMSLNAANKAEPTIFSMWRDLPLGQIPGLGDTPNPGGMMAQVWIATDKSGTELDGNVYALSSAYGTSGLDVHFCRSDDAGLTWADYARVDDDNPNSSAYQWFAMMSVAPNGRIDAAWNDTRNTGDPKVSELYYSFSADGGQTWALNIPVSLPFNTWVGWPQNAKIGDYYHMHSDNLGANIAYAATFNNEQDIYFLRIGPYDCNGNEVADETDIAEGTSLDCNQNDVPDECEYRADYDGDALTTPADYAQYVTCQKTAQAPVTGCCALFDIEPDGDIDLADFAFLQRAFNSP